MRNLFSRLLMAFAIFSIAGQPIAASAQDTIARAQAASALTKVGQAQLKTRLLNAAAAAEAANLSTRPVSGAAATTTSPSSAPAITGFTSILPINQGYAASVTGTATAGSPVVGVNTVSGLVVGQHLVEANTQNRFPANVPPGSVINGINPSALTVTLSRAATGTASGLTLRAASEKIEYIGGVPVDNGGNLWLSAITTGNSVNPPTEPRTSATGNAYEFMTDAANFSTSSASVMLFGFLNGANPASYRVAIDDVYQTSDPVAFGSAGSVWLTIQLAVTGTHKVRIEFPGGFMPQKLYVLNGASVWKPNRGAPIRAAFYGDSFMGGGQAGSWQMRNMAALASLQLGWLGDLASVAGTGYVSGGGTNWNFQNAYRLADLTRRPYDVVVCLGSVNDNGQSPAVTQAAYLATWQGIRARLPNAPIFIFGVGTNKSISAAGATALEAAQKAAFTQWGDANAFYFPITTDPSGPWVIADGSANDNSAKYVSSDNNHPGDGLGMPYYADKMVARIKATLPLLAPQ